MRLGASKLGPKDFLTLLTLSTINTFIDLLLKLRITVPHLMKNGGFPSNWLTNYEQINHFESSCIMSENIFQSFHIVASQR